MPLHTEEVDEKHEVLFLSLFFCFYIIQIKARRRKERSCILGLFPKYLSKKAVLIEIKQLNGMQLIQIRHTLKEHVK